MGIGGALKPGPPTPCIPEQVDVEGCELEVLRGMDAHTWALTRQVVAEVHSGWCGSGGGGGPGEQRVTEVQGLLERNGFAVHVEVPPAALPGTCLVRAWNMALAE